MREKFEQFIRDQSGLNFDFEIGCNGQYKSDLMHFMFTTWCYQQSEIDALQKRINDSIFILSTIDNPDEAYKAIDLLLRALRGEQALKDGVQ